MGYIWLALAIVFGVLEAMTAQLVSIWFTGGAIAALIGAVLGADSTWQVVIFIIVSAVLLVATRGIAKKLTSGEKVRTNADSLIGKTAVVTKDTDDMGLFGEAKIAGGHWTIASEDGEPIEKGERVTVKKIEGVKLVVSK